MANRTSVGGNGRRLGNVKVPGWFRRVGGASHPSVFPLQLAASQEGRRCRVECDNLCEMDGVRLGYTDDTVTITEADYGCKAVPDNKDNIISSDFNDDFVPFIKNYFWSNYSMVKSDKDVDWRDSNA